MAKGKARMVKEYKEFKLEEILHIVELNLDKQKVLLANKEGLKHWLPIDYALPL